MADLATLQVKIEAKQAIAETKALGKAMDQTGVSAEILEKRAASLARVQAAQAAATQQNRAAFAHIIPQQAAAARVFTASAASTERMTRVMATLGGTTRTASTAARAASVAMAGAFGPGSIAGLAFVAFGSTVVRELLNARTAMDETRDKWADTLRDMINEGAVFKMKKELQDLRIGTPADGFADGIGARERRLALDKATLERLKGQTLGAFGKSSTFKAISETETRIGVDGAALDALKLKAEALEKAILDVTNVPFSRSGPLPIVTNAKMLADELTRAARMANELQRVSGLLSMNTVDSRGRRIGIGASIPTSGFGRTGYTPGDPVMGIPGRTGFDSLGTGSLINTRPFISDEVKLAAEAAKNFRENIQRGLGDFFAEFATEGRASIRTLFSGVQSMGGNILGNAISSKLTPRIDSLSFGGQIAAGGALAMLGGVVTSFLNAGDRARALAAAFAEVTRNIADFKAQATDTPEQAELRRLQNQRDDTARAAASAVGFSGLTGSADEIRRIMEVLAGGPNVGGLATNARRLLDTLDDLEEAFGANVDAARKAAAAQRAAALTQTIDSLRGFASGLKLSDLSIYNPFQQQDEARRVYEDVLAKARGGDQGAASQLPAAARAFLEQSRGINASGSRYVADFQRVEQDTAAVLAEFGNQLDIQQRILDAADRTNENTNRIGDETRRGSDAAEMSLAVQQATGRGTLERLDLLIARVDELTRVERMGWYNAA